MDAKSRARSKRGLETAYFVRGSWCVFIGGLFLLLTGCTTGPRLVPVKGVLTYKGTPVAKVQLDFVPETGRPSWGQTDADGRFVLEYDSNNKGAVLGKHKVFAKLGAGWQKTPADPLVIPRELDGFFEKYGPLNSTVEVQIDANTRDLTLAWD